QLNLGQVVPISLPGVLRVQADEAANRLSPSSRRLPDQSETANLSPSRPFGSREAAWETNATPTRVMPASPVSAGPGHYAVGSGDGVVSGAALSGPAGAIAAALHTVGPDHSMDHTVNSAPGRAQEVSSRTGRVTPPDARPVRKEGI